jgi:hypothetical protein
MESQAALTPPEITNATEDWFFAAMAAQYDGFATTGTGNCTKWLIQI